jgi:hypothetical protein
MNHALGLAVARRLIPSILVAAPLLFAALPAGAAVPGSLGGPLGDLRDPVASLVQTAHCRAVWHTHRRCVRWSGGVCRAWRTWRHRC